MKKLKQNKIYLVDWLDANSSGDWFAEEGVEQISDIIVQSVGFFINEKNDYLCFACFVSNGTFPYGNVFKIPKGCVTKIKEIK